MNPSRISKHLLIALAITAASYVLFTVARGITPDPEDFSPFAYLAAFLWLLAACLRLPRKQPHKWAYWLIFALCTLAFLDEAGYGVEVFGFSSLHVEPYNVDIHDLHNLIAIWLQLFTAWLERSRWNGLLFANLMLFNAALLVAGGLFLAAARRGLAKASQARWQARLLPLAAGALAAVGLLASAYLLALPRDPKNELLLGLSAIRLGSVVVMLLASLAPLALVWRSRRSVEQALQSALKQHRGRAVWLLGLVVAAMLAFQFYVPFLPHPDQVARVQRLIPVALWLLSSAYVLLLAALLWSGSLRQPLLPQWWQRLLAFLRREPAFIYAVVGVVLIAIAQAIDREWIPLNLWIQTPGYHVRLWGLWTEEAFEMIGAYQFMAAGFVFPKRNKKK